MLQTVVKLGTTFYVTFKIGAHVKRWYGNRDELIDLQDKISKVLDIVDDNQDGKRLTSRTPLHELYNSSEL